MSGEPIPGALPSDAELVAQLQQKCAEIKTEIGKVIIGQDAVIENLIIALFSRGHCIFVGVPGLAKTLLVKTLSEALDLTFKRIQFTPDLMPSDITGTEILEEEVGSGKRFNKFIKGPVFSHLVLADEINRTPPKTQAALLEAMQEYHVTAGGQKYPLPLPFLVLATQNPIEQEGTYPLPEAQLDRFMMYIVMDYPALQEEIDIVKTTTIRESCTLRKILTPEQILEFQNLIPRVPASDQVIAYAVKLARESRPKTPDAPDFIKKWVSWGAGPRASQFLILGAKARAILQGRPTVSFEDVQALAIPILRHRIIPNFVAEAEGISSIAIIEKLLATVTVAKKLI
jgi:MoxR-like ATPase